MTLMTSVARSRLRSAATLLVLALAFAASATTAGDGRLIDQVKLALILENSIDASDLQVDVDAGQATIHGSVGSDAERRKTIAVAKAVEGVTSVVDLTQVVPSSHRNATALSDSIVRRRLERALARNPRLDDASIEIASVTDGVVVLAGTVRSTGDAVRAIRTARAVPGVHQVSSILEIPGADEFMIPADNSEDTWGADAPDWWITRAVKRRLIATAGVPALAIHVDTTDHVVTLFGEVESVAQSERAETATLEVIPVEQVENRLVVSETTRAPLAKIADEEVARDVRTKLERDPTVPGEGIEILVNNGIVELRGMIDDDAARIRAVVAARGVPGVRAVIDRIHLADDRHPNSSAQKTGPAGALNG